MTRLLLALTTIAALMALAITPASAQSAFPERIELPDGFQPEGIAIAGTQFYVGSIPTGRVYRGDLRTGEGDVLVQQQAGRAAIGIKVDRGRLFVAGGGTGDAYVYDATTGATIATYDFASAQTFVNDVVVTKGAAWFTDSMRPSLYRVALGPGGQPASTFTTVSLSGDYPAAHVPGSFNVNGIDATPNGKTLLIVQSNTGNLFTVAPDGDASKIDLDEGERVPMGDGILLDGHTLYVVQNRLNLVAEIALSAKLDSGRVVSRTGNPDFDVPTTIAEHGNRLYAVNARFRIPPQPPLVQPADYWITQLRK
jgi:sugar lactone lactonase YvrE